MSVYRALAVLCGCTLFGAAQGAGTEYGLTAQDLHYVQQVESRSWDARQANDAAFFERLLASDHVQVDRTGIADKAAVLAAIRDKACTMQRHQLAPFRLGTPAPNLVVLSYRAEHDLRCGAAAATSPVWVTSAYVRRGDTWVRVLNQLTPAE